MDKRWLRYNIYGLLFALIVAVSVIGFQWWKFLVTPLIPKTHQPILFEVKTGMTSREVVRLLTEKRVLSHPNFFLVLAWLEGATRTLQAGEYELEPGITPPQLLQKLQKGQVILRSVTILSGWRFSQIKALLHAESGLKHDSLRLTNDEIMTKIGAPGKQPEGQFYPDTYLFAAESSELQVLKRAYSQMQFVLNQEWKQRASNLPYRCPFEALIAASLITKETHIPQERSKIAGVIVRRLKKDMRLQIDPTVIYALGAQFEPPLTYEDLKLDNPYNTYLYRGLPPTPIANPTRADIHAALHPDPGDSLYYVARQDGSHIFSSTLKAHQLAKQRIARETK